jgi:thioesterase domain-containing protein
MNGPGTPTLVLVSILGAGFSYGPWLAAVNGRHPRRLVDVDSVAGRTIAGLAAEQVEPLRASLADVPVAFAGWSAGGVLAHEMARVWHESVGGRPPVLMIDSTALTSPRPVPAHDFLNSFLSDLSLSTGIPAPTLAPDDARRAPREVLAAMVARLRQQGRAYQLDLTDLLARYEAFGEVTRLVREHDPTPYPGPVCFVQAAEAAPKAAAWAPYCGSLRVVVLPGNHYTVLRTQPEQLVRLGTSLLESSTAAHPTSRDEVMR